MPTRKELQELAQLRLKEAETLFEAGLYDGAAYLCGYVIEFALKARICKLLEVNQYPPSIENKNTQRITNAYAIHDCDQLSLLARFKSQVDLTRNPGLYANWSTATDWTPEMRYQPKGTVSREQAEERLNAVRNKTDGVFTWIKKYW